MRATSFSSIAVLALMLQANGALAQSSVVPDHQPATSDKAKLDDKPDSGRVGTLSPDEARRAARARKRAASSLKPALVKKADEAATSRPAMAPEHAAIPAAVPSKPVAQAVVPAPKAVPRADAPAKIQHADSARRPVDAPQHAERAPATTKGSEHAAAPTPAKLPLHAAVPAPTPTIRHAEAPPTPVKPVEHVGANAHVEPPATSKTAHAGAPPVPVAPVAAERASAATANANRPYRALAVAPSDRQTPDISRTQARSEALAHVPADRPAQQEPAHDAVTARAAPDRDVRHTARVDRHHGVKQASRPRVHYRYAGDPSRDPRVGDIIPPGVRLGPLPPGYWRFGRRRPMIFAGEAGPGYPGPIVGPRRFLPPPYMSGYSVYPGYGYGAPVYGYGDQ